MSTWNEGSISRLQSVRANPGDDAIVAGYQAPGDLGGGAFHWEGAAPAAATVADVSAADAIVIDASNETPVRITAATPHGYVTSQTVLIAGVQGNGNTNGVWIITVKTPTTISLNGSRGSGPYANGGAAHAATISTGAAHGLRSGQQTMISGVRGGRRIAGLNGRWRLTVLSPTTFSIGAQALGRWAGGGLIGDGGITIPSAVAIGRWHRIHSGLLSVRWFGATGNGSADDGPSIQTAVDIWRARLSRQRQCGHEFFPKNLASGFG